MKHSDRGVVKFLVVRFTDHIHIFGMDHITNIIYIPDKEIEVRFNNDVPFVAKNDDAAVDEIFIHFYYAIGYTEDSAKTIIAAWKNDNAQ